MSDEPQAIQGVRKALKELVDGTLRVQIDIEPRDKAAFHKLFPEIDVPVALAPLRLQLTGETYGEEARQLVASGFFAMPAVWREIAHDKAYRNWLLDRPCAAKASNCNGQIVAAHYRKVADGSGTGIKNDYGEIPLCHFHHHLQHQRGYSAVGNEQWWAQQRVKYVTTWARESLKYQLGYESWKQVPPSELWKWAIEHELADFLPKCYLPHAK